MGANAGLGRAREHGFANAAFGPVIFDGDEASAGGAQFARASALPSIGFTQ